MMDYYQFFKKTLGEDISERSWRRYKKLLTDNELSLTKDNLLMLANLRKLAKSHKLNLAVTLKVFLNHNLVQNLPPQLTREELLQKLSTLTHKPHRITIQRWLGVEHTFSNTEALLVILKAFQYQINSNKKLTRG